MDSKVVVMVGIIVAVLFFLTNGDKKEATDCISIEPEGATFLNSEIIGMLEDLNYTDIINFRANYENYTGYGYCEESNQSNVCVKSRGIWIFNLDELPKNIKESNTDSYKGIGYKLIGRKDVEADPNGIYFNPEKSIFIIFSAQEDNKIIEAYIDKYYECSSEI